MTDRVSYVLGPGRHPLRGDRRDRAVVADRGPRRRPRRRRARRRLRGGERRRRLRGGHGPGRHRRRGPARRCPTPPAASCGPASPPTARPATRSSSATTTSACSLPATRRRRWRQPVGPPVGLGRIDHVVANVELGNARAVGRLLRPDLRLRPAGPLRRRHDLHRVLGADVDGGVGRVEGRPAHQRAGRGAAQEPDRGVPRLLRRARRAAHRPADRRHRDGRAGPAGPGRPLPAGAGRPTTRTPRSAWPASTFPGRRWPTSGSWSTATTRATSSRSSPRPWATGRPSSSRSSSGKGSRGFGAGNFKALFEAIEREQERRGNL